MNTPDRAVAAGGGADLNRREFLAKAGVAAVTMLAPGIARAGGAVQKIRLGIVGCGGRGSWISALFQKHGGYEIVACADYFADRVEAFGAKFAVPRARQFTGLSGYRRLLESGVDAIAIESPPYFHPEQAAAGVDAGVHVYLAKPIAVDVPGTRLIEASARKASAKKLCFLVDFQTRAHQTFIEAIRRVHAGALGDIIFGEATYHDDCPFQQWYDLLTKEPDNPESILRGWGLDRALSGDMITEQDIHALDVMNWIMQSPPLWATGNAGLKARPKIGTSSDYFAVYYQYPKGVAVQFSGRQFKGHGTVEGIRNRMFGSRGVLETEYGGSVLIRGEEFYNGGRMTAIYEEGAVHNIAAFQRCVAEGDDTNATVPPSVQSNLVTILGRKAAYENRQVTWSELMADEIRMLPRLEGLKD